MRIDGEEHGKHFVSEAFSIGRAADNDMVVEDLRVSRHHALLTAGADALLARDLGSANGTALNGIRLSGGDHPVHDGDILTIGGASFICHNDLDRACPRLRQTAGVGREYAIRGTLSIGRLPANDIVVDDPKVSRHHAEISAYAGMVTIRDLDSLNGTRVNGELITGRHLLHGGETISVGDAFFVYLDERGAEDFATLTG
jgi:pSer/pThr/pTyr-binding forkhead associated (FHA) protein